MITRKLAETLSYRTELHHKTRKGSDKQPIRCRVSGKCKTWKTRPLDFKLPVKYGLYESFYITPENADEWELPGHTPFQVAVKIAAEKPTKTDIIIQHCKENNISIKNIKAKRIKYKNMMGIPKSIDEYEEINQAINYEALKNK